MGRINARTKGPVNYLTQLAARAVGAGRITYTGRIDHTYTTSATKEVANRIAALPQTSEVFPDEPTYLA